MKNIKLLVLCLLLTGCGSSKPGTQTTPLNGVWNVTVSQSGDPDVTLNATLVPSSCQITEGGRQYAIQESQCVSSASVSSINSTYTPVGVLLGASNNPASNGASISVLLFEVDSSNTMYVFLGSGSISNGQLVGTWGCYPSAISCQGWVGSFVASK